MEDHGFIASWTRHTFSWGDYVEERYKDWIADPSGAVFVAADDDDRAVAVGNVKMLSPYEAWAQGARVHPDHRRRGIGTELSAELWEWAAEQGARVVRLAVEDWNEAALAQVTAMGFRKVADFRRASRAVGDASPVPEGNGGRRVPAPERLRAVPSSEADPAFLSWSGGPLAPRARGLFAQGWQWRRLRAEDLADAARDGQLWEGRPGWALGSLRPQGFRVGWLDTTPEDAHAMARALVDLAANGGAELLDVKIPAVDWLERAFRRVGSDLLPIGIFAKSLRGA